MKKILIVGGAGYIGTRLSNYLSNETYHSGSEKYQVTVLDNFWFGDFLDEKVIKIKKNLWDITLNDLDGIDVVLFLAGLSNDPMAMFRPDLNFIEKLPTCS